MVTAWMTGKSLRFTASSTSRPMPGMLKKTSIRKLPTKMPGNCSPMLVRIGIIALRSTCRNSTTRSVMPLARAVRT